MSAMNFPYRKKQRRDEAVKRREEYSKLSKKEKLADLDRRPGKSARERARLEKKNV